MSTTHNPTRIDRPVGEVSRLTITLRYYAEVDDGQPWAWSTEYGHGMARSPNEAAAQAHAVRASILSRTAAESRLVADRYDDSASDHDRVARMLTAKVPPTLPPDGVIDERRENY